jgi:hypothetical protein
MHPVNTWPASDATLKAIPAALIGSILLRKQTSNSWASTQVLFQKKVFSDKAFAADTNNQSVKQISRRNRFEHSHNKK